jgi:rRNA small subunit pseudouridine methyltransferase Nep1
MSAVTSVESNSYRKKRPAPAATNTAKLPKVDEKSRKLIVVLAQACLETYKVSISGKEDKYMLLNADDHVGSLV